ncbi:hypothetical protein HDV57DRAFT_501394 [Trichoderma longibrachiatum]
MTTGTSYHVHHTYWPPASVRRPRPFVSACCSFGEGTSAWCMHSLISPGRGHSQVCHATLECVISSRSLMDLILCDPLRSCFAFSADTEMTIDESCNAKIYGIWGLITCRIRTHEMSSTAFPSPADGSLCEAILAT